MLTSEPEVQHARRAALCRWHDDGCLPTLADLSPFFASAGSGRQGPRPAGEGQDRTTARARAKGRRILIVEDNVDFADALRVLLDHAGYDVAIAHTGREALALARSFHPDAVLLEIGLRDVNGYSVARRIRERLKPDGVRLIALTVYARDAEKELAQGARFDHYLVKPVPFDAILAVLPHVRRN